MFYFYQILYPLNELKTIRGCSTSTKYCHPWTSWRLYQRVFYFYQILSPLNKLKTISEGVLLLPNTVALEQVEDCIRGCSTSTKYCHPWTSWRLYISDGVLLLPNTVILKQVEDYIRAGADPLEKDMIFWRKIVIFHTKYPTNFRASLRSAQFFLSPPPPPPPPPPLAWNPGSAPAEGVLLLPNTVTLQQVEDYIRECSTSAKYCPR